jgi:thymidylate kinase
MRRAGLFVAVEGPSAIGKSTVVAALAERAGWVALAEAFDRLDPPPDLDYRFVAALRSVEATLLREEVRRYAAARALTARGLNVVGDTGMLGPFTYTAGLVHLGLAPRAALAAVRAQARRYAFRGRLGLPDLTVYLRGPPALLRARARRAAAHHPAGLMRRHWEVARFEFEAIRPLVEQLLPGRVMVVEARRPPQRIAASIDRRARPISPLREPSRRLAAVLGALSSRHAPSGPKVTLKKWAPPAPAPRR